VLSHELVSSLEDGHSRKERGDTNRRESELVGCDTSHGLQDRTLLDDHELLEDLIPTRRKCGARRNGKGDAPPRVVGR
jgi:hypothetical protein